MKNDILNKIHNPDNIYRSTPFWAWNSELEIPELLRQMSIFKKMGFGGFFMHSRFGLQTPYLGEKWFQCVEACVNEAKKLGMNAWIYDEDRWPSGYGGGKVTAADSNYAMTTLKMEVSDKPDYAAESLAFFAGKINDNDISGYRRLSPGQKLACGESFLRFYTVKDAPSDWFNGQSYLDAMNEKAVAEFIRVSYREYADRFPQELGRTVPGAFTDEPFISNWSNLLPAKFISMHNYDICDHLPELFFTVEGKSVSKVRLDYHNTRTELFVTAYAAQIGSFCEKHNLIFTGHVLGEGVARTEAKCVGSTMRFYEYMSMPGIDLLGQQDNNICTVKQCVSVARQFGRRTRLCECYGCTGWDFPLAGHKATGDWLAALGINHRCQHLAWYTMKGAAKRDYPASISYQSPWTEVLGTIENHFAGLAALFAGCDDVCDLLVIHPMESVWFYKPLWSDFTPEENNDANFALNRLVGRILKENIDFDFGDESIIARFGKVNEKGLVVKEASYRKVLIPELLTIRSTTLDLLDRFASAGGEVLYVGDAPAYVDGVKSAKAAEVYAKFTSVSLADAGVAAAENIRKVSVSTDGGEIDPVLCRIGRGQDYSVLFVCNTGTGQTVSDADMPNFAPVLAKRDQIFPDATVKWMLPERQLLFEVFPDGRVAEIDSTYENGAAVFKTSFTTLQSRTFIACCENIATAEIYPPAATGEIPLDDTFTIETDEPNALVLDHCRYAVNGENLSEKCFILDVGNQLHDRFGVPRRTGSGKQPWAESAPPVTADSEIELHYEFKCDTLPEKLYLGVESPEKYTFTLNGRAFEPEISGSWCDRAVVQLAVPRDLLLCGVNQLQLTADCRRGIPALEAIYLLGDFGVKDDVITKAPEFLQPGDWCQQGLPYYSANVTYSTSFCLPPGVERIRIGIPQWAGTALAVSVNDAPFSALVCAPWEIDIDQALVPGENSLKIKVYSSRRNVCGPFYINEENPKRVGVAELSSYLTGGRKNLVPQGLLTSPVVKF